MSRGRGRETGRRVRPLEWRRRLPSVWCKWTPKLNLVVPTGGKRSMERGGFRSLPVGRPPVWDYDERKVAYRNIRQVSFADCFWLRVLYERSPANECSYICQIGGRRHFDATTRKIFTFASKYPILLWEQQLFRSGLCYVCHARW